MSSENVLRAKWRRQYIPNAVKPATESWTCWRCNYMNGGPICTKCGNAIISSDDNVCVEIVPPKE